MIVRSSGDTERMKKGLRNLVRDLQRVVATERPALAPARSGTWHWHFVDRQRDVDGPTRRGVGCLSSRSSEVVVNAVEIAAPVHAEEPVAPPEPSTVEVTLTFFKGGEKAKGFRRTVTWDRLYTVLANAPPTKAPNKLALPGWCAATFNDDHRRLASVESVSAIVLDFDNTHRPHGTKQSEPLPPEKRTTPEAALAAWADTKAFFYTSWSNTPELPKFRLVLPLSRTVTASEFATLWAHVAGVHERAGHVVDGQCKDASHLWFLGAKRDDNYSTGMQPGALLDVDAILVAASMANDIALDDQLSDSTVQPEATDAKTRASRYLAGMPEAISGSGGHTTTFKAAIALVRGFSLEAAVALDLLRAEYNPRCQPPWSERELRHKIEGAEKLHSPPLGYLLNRRQSASAALREILATTEPTEAGVVLESHDVPFTDDGNALRLVDAVGGHIRYVVEWRSFIRWNGKVWERDPEGHLVREDMRALARRWADAAVKIEDEETRKRALAWAHKSQSVVRLDAAVNLSKGDGRIRIRASELDAHPLILNVQNGILDLRDTDAATRTCKLLAHDPKYLLTRITKYAYVPEATCLTWTTFCTFSANGDAEVEAYRRRRRGSYLSGAPDKVFEIAFGKGDTGKTSYYQTVTRVLGSYAQKVPRTIFEKQRNEQHPADLMELEGVRFVFGAEIEDQIDIKKVKDVTGERVIKARGMRQDWQTIERKYKVAIFSNDAPQIRRTTNDPIWNRIHADRWEAIITEKRNEAEIDEVYDREGEGILADMVRGWVEFQMTGLAPPKAIVDATRTYRNEEDPIEEWLDACCNVTDAAATTPFKSLWASRQEWLEENDPDLRETKKAFAKHLDQRGIEGTKDANNRAAVRIGVKLIEAIDSGANGEVDADLPEPPFMSDERHPLETF